jgi:Ser/Thr protein kinase RdoA (MazF antagonist)
VSLSVSAAAARAAVSVAARLGVRGEEPVVLADGANVIVHLSPAPVVAKVAASTPAVRPDVGAWLRRELDLAAFLGAAGVPVMAPSPEVPAAVHDGDGHVMTFWTYVPSSGALADDATIGSMLRDLHAALRSYPEPMTVLGPLADIPAFLARPRSQVSASDAAILAETYQRLTADLDRWPTPVQVLHGDAGGGNLMASDGRWIWHDFEDTCSGPVAWDLAASTANARRDRARILAAYGDTVDPSQLRTCEQLRRLHLTIWYALYAERLPECRERAIELITSWRHGR